MAEDKSTSIGELETRLAEMENNWKRALADYRNFQKRAEEEKSVFVLYATESLIRQLLPVLDNLVVYWVLISLEGFGLILAGTTMH